MKINIKSVFSKNYTIDQQKAQNGENANKISSRNKHVQFGSKSSSIKPKIPFSTWLIIISELFEKYVYFSFIIILTNYIRIDMKYDDYAAVMVHRFFSFTVYIFTILASFLADNYFGRFKVILFFSALCFIGLILINIANAAIIQKNSNHGILLFFIGCLAFFACGTSGVKANISAFAAEQISTNNNVLYALTIERLFRYFYCAINLGTAAGIIIQSQIYHSSIIPKVWLFVPPLLVYALSILIFCLGGKIYVKSKQCQRNPIFRAIKSIYYAIKNRHLLKNDEGQTPHWLEVAKYDQNISVAKGDHKKFIDDLKVTIEACKVFPFYVIYWCIYNNLMDLIIIQCSMMERPNWMQGYELLMAINPISVVIFVPIFDFLVFPMLRNKFGFKLKIINRITIGFVVCSIGFMYDAVLQYFIYKTGPNYDFTKLSTETAKLSYNNISVYYQIVLYIILVISEMFASTAGFEFAFKYAAPQLKSFVLAMYLLSVSMGELLGMALSPFFHHPYYTILIASESIFLVITTLIFYLKFKNKNF